MVEALANLDPTLIWFAVFGGLLAGFLTPYFSRQTYIPGVLKMALLIFLVYFSLTNLNRFIKALNGNVDWDVAWVHFVSTSLRWWLFIFSMVGMMTIMAWWHRRKHDDLS